MQSEMLEKDSHDNQLLKELRKNTFRFSLKRLKTASLKQLSQICGTTNEVAESLVTELCASGEVILEQTDDGTKYHFNAKYKLVLIITVLGKNQAFAAVNDLYGDFLEKNLITASTEELQFYDSVVENYLAKYPAIGILAFGIPGFEDQRSGKIYALDFPILEVEHFQNHFLDKYGLSSILENETNAAIIGLYENRNLSENKCVTAMFMPSSRFPGSAICIDGKVYKGRNNAAGEIRFFDTGFYSKLFEKKDFNYNQIDVLGFITRIASAFIAFLNPDIFVIYCPWLSENIVEELNRQLLEIMPKEFIPKIDLIPDIVPDLLNGLVHMALNELEPKVTFEDN